MALHVHTTRLADALEASELTTASLAEASGLGLDRIEGILAGTRCLSRRQNLERLATPLGLQWQALCCDGEPSDRCPACRAHNKISDAERTGGLCKPACLCQCPATGGSARRSPGQPRTGAHRGHHAASRCRSQG